MSNPIELLKSDERAGAIAFLSEMAGRDLNAQDLAATDQEAFDDAVTMARRILRAAEAARAELPPTPRAAGQLNAADAQALRLDLGAEAIAILAWMPGEAPVDIALAATANRTAAWRCAPDRAAGLTELITAAFPSAPPSPASTPETQS